MKVSLSLHPPPVIFRMFMLLKGFYKRFARGCANFTQLIALLLSGRPRSPLLLLILAVVSHCDCYNLWPSLQTPSSHRKCLISILLRVESEAELRMQSLKEYPCFCSASIQYLNVEVIKMLYYHRHSTTPVLAMQI